MMLFLIQCDEVSYESKTVRFHLETETDNNTIKFET